VPALGLQIKNLGAQANVNQGSTRRALCLTSLTIVLTFMTIAAGDTGGPKIVDQKEFSIIGIEARTNNAKEMNGDGVIPKQWDNFFKEGILQKIPNKTDPNIFVVYTDYASDRNGDYTYVIGAKVSDVSAVPPGMVVEKVPKGKYVVLTSAKGQVQKIVPDAWRQIWSLEDKSQLGGPRAYKTDFEVYDQRSQNPQDSQVDLYVGIK
jgi:predicted transcriptional regulator YdeE